MCYVVKVGIWCDVVWFELMDVECDWVVNGLLDWNGKW